MYDYMTKKLISVDITSVIYIFLWHSDRSCRGTQLSQDANFVGRNCRGTQKSGRKCRDASVGTQLSWTQMSGRKCRRTQLP
jgi:hypothetical protein